MKVLFSLASVVWLAGWLVCQQDHTMCIELICTEHGGGMGSGVWSASLIWVFHFNMEQTCCFSI